MATAGTLDVLTVIVSSIEHPKRGPALALVQDHWGTQRTLNAEARLGSGPMPQPGEVWTAHRAQGGWIFHTLLRPVRPKITGPVRTTDPRLRNLLDALSGLGIVVDETTDVAPPVLGGNLEDGDKVRALVALLDGLGLIDDQSVSSPVSNDRIYHVGSDAEQAQLVSWYQPDITRPLMIMRTDRGGLMDIRTTYDGQFWSTIQTARMPAGWLPLPVVNGWLSYHGADPNYPVTSYLKTSAEIVVYSGLLRNGTLGQTAATMPLGYRPDGQLLLPTMSSNAINVTRVNADGTINIPTGSSVWSGLDSIMYPAADPSRVWTPFVLGGGWQDYHDFDASFPPCGWWQDRYGRIWVHGMVRRVAGIPAVGTPIVSGLPPMGTQRMPGANGAGGFVSLGTSGGAIIWVSGTSPAAWLALPSGPYFPTGVGTWIEVPLANSWANLGGGWPTAAVAVWPDGIGSLRGMVSGGTSVGASMFNAPVNMRSDPAHNRLFPVNSADALGRGNLSLGTTVGLASGSVTWASLTGMNYYTEA